MFQMGWFNHQTSLKKIVGGFVGRGSFEAPSGVSWNLHGYPAGELFNGRCCVGVGVGHLEACSAYPK